ncbi:MAG: FAD-dependent oxidoreductase, partial [Hymenobacter sp.]
MLESPQTVENNAVYDIIISGAGPVGLFLACELALANCTVLLLEKAPQPHSPLKQLPFGLRGLNALSVEALDRRGVLQELELHKNFKLPHAT